MKFDICLKDNNDLHQDDLSLSLGWFELSEKEVNLRLFNDRSCMIFITLADLFEFLGYGEQKRTRTFDWIGVDNGVTIKVVCDGSIVSISKGDIVVRLEKGIFVSAVLKGTEDFIARCLVANQRVEEESAFLDLMATFNRVNSTFSPPSS
ncbi:hypothetical protein [Taibaiella soli]|uniref:Uncharacterized protein n=1 Tax=Taibaiella soli TaxID=1649169 RepID=A0A2W2AMN9_9BACT|nr:hypothetical protein [Taibaiella soli]PZF74802.1 hypothetical protein DN068_00980 [Taibaiella soli]